MSKQIYVNGAHVAQGPQAQSLPGTSTQPALPPVTQLDVLASRLQQMLDRMDLEAGPIPEDVQQRIDALDWPA